MDRNPQAKQMADESMVRNLRAQAEALWPQEQAVFAGHGMPSTILDIGCGTLARSCTSRRAYSRVPPASIRISAATCTGT